MSTTQQQAAPKKPIYKRVWFWLLVALAVIIIGAASSNGGDGKTGGTPSTGGAQSAPGQAEPAAEQPADDPLTDSGWTVSDIQVETTAIGPSISGRVTNNEGQARTGVWTLTVFSNGQRVYDAMGSAQEVEGGGTATVTFVSSSSEEIAGDPATFTYELQSDL